MSRQSAKNPVRVHTNQTTKQSRIYKVYELVLNFQAPLLSQQVGTLSAGIDSMMQRYQGKPVLNGSLVKGNLRHALYQLALLLPPTQQEDLEQAISRWFGYKPQVGQEDERQWQGDLARGNVYFNTFWCYKGKSDHPTKLRNRIKINEHGTVEEGALMSLEECFPLDSQPQFSGLLRASFDSQHEQQQFEHSIEKACQLIPAMGSFKGIGFGRLLSSTLQVSAPKQPSIPTLKDKSRIGLRLRFDQPFCVGRPRTNHSNRIESDSFISGAVLKGAIAQHYARTLAEQGLSPDALSKRLRNKYQFDDLIISHALPSSVGSEYRSVPIPFSLVAHKTGLFDASGYTLEALLEVLARASDQPASFQLDWKSEWAAASKLCQQASPLKRITLVRTEINPERNSAEESRLFSMECIDPKDTEWLCYLDLSKIKKDKQSLWRDLLALLAQGIDGIGKTKAHASVEFVPEGFSSPAAPLLDSFTQAFELNLVLVTQARMLPRQLERRLEASPPDVQTDQMLHDLYSDYWQQHSDNGLSLVRYFAQQKRYGGEYAKRHYQQAQPYAPEWLTEAGSVFVLRVANEYGLRCLKAWQQQGLPAASDSDGQSPTWKTTAYLPENGYGEICMNWSILDEYHSPDTAYPVEEALKL